MVQLIGILLRKSETVNLRNILLSLFGDHEEYLCLAKYAKINSDAVQVGDSKGTTTQKSEL